MTLMKFTRLAVMAATLITGGSTLANAQTAFLEITLNVAVANRPAAAAVYAKYKKPFLMTVKGAVSKQLLIRDEDVQVLHGFNSIADAKAYLASDFFTHDVVRELGPLVKGDPEVRIYSGD